MDREQIIERIKQTALLHGDFTLRSGRRSHYYLDKYLFETQPDILHALGEMFIRRFDRQINRLAGAELGGIPLVTVASIASGVPAIFIRNEKKSYGTARQLEGRLDKGDRVVIVEDIATTGGQVLEAAQVIVDAGGRVEKIIAVIDRAEGARANIEHAGFEFESLFSKSDMGIDE